MKRQDIDQRPLVSIIIVVYNGANLIAQAVTSVLCQTLDSVELIVVDGKSTDGTLSCLEKYSDRIATIISESDSGIYDAMNKGVRASHGRWLYFLGSDDYLASETVLEEIFCALSQAVFQPQLVFGYVCNQYGRLIRSRWDWNMMLHNTLHHQSCFYHADLFVNFCYDVSFKLIADYELNLTCYLAHKPCLSLPVVVAVCRDGGASTTPVNFHVFVHETNEIRRRIVPLMYCFLMNIIFHIKCNTWLFWRRFRAGLNS